MKETGIIFSAPMVRAIQDGRKTMTRRIVKPQPHVRCSSFIDLGGGEFKPVWDGEMPSDFTYHNRTIRSPYGTVGDRLWVKESAWYPPKQITTKMLREGADTWPRVIYDDTNEEDWLRDHGWRHVSGRFMPRWASRFKLENTLVRMERLQDITEEDAIAEGVFPHIAPGQELKKFNGNHAALALAALAEFRNLWNTINGKSHPWESNPMVLVIGFKRVEGGAS